MQTPPAERTAREEARLNQRAREELTLLGMHSAISTASGTGSAAPHPLALTPQTLPGDGAVDSCLILVAKSDAWPPPTFPFPHLPQDDAEPRCPSCLRRALCPEGE